MLYVLGADTPDFAAGAMWEDAKVGGGHIRTWEPPWRLVLSWREASFAADQETELQVRFDEVDAPGEAAQTRVTVEHFGWDRLPPEHAARHGMPLATFQHRFAQWWQELLQTLTDLTAGDRP